MLVLSRKQGESILIGENIEVRIIDLQGDRVRLGFTAPTTVSIHRSEVAERIAQEITCGMEEDRSSHGKTTERPRSRRSRSKLPAATLQSS